MNLDVVRERLSQLLEKADELVQGRYRSQVSMQEFVDAAAFREWRVGSIAFLNEALGADSPYTKEFEFNCDSPYLSAVARGLAVLRAAREYIDFGPVARVEELVAAEIFIDLLGIARRMIREGRAVAAVTIGSAVLEDVMRRSARHRRIDIRENVDDIGALNTKLAAASVYRKLMQDKIDRWAAMRARAENNETASREEVEAMLKGVQDFLNDHLF